MEPPPPSHYSQLSANRNRRARAPTQDFDLASELSRLEMVRTAQAHEAVIFYCARILEGTARLALEACGQPAKGDLVACLNELGALSRLDPVTAQCAHALRRLGNLVRHEFTPVKGKDSESSAAFLACWLRWLSDQQLASSVKDLSDRLSVPPHITSALSLLATKQVVDPEDATSSPLRVAAAESAVFAALWIELLMNADKENAARRLLEGASHRFPNDVRLKQLCALLASRSGQLDKAITILTPLTLKRYIDAETSGILAGAYKRRWEKTGNQRDLAKSHYLYKNGYNSSGMMNVYLGINAATTAIFLGNAYHFSEISINIVEQLTHDRNDLRKSNTGRDLQLWDQLTLAEALLLNGKDQDAREEYLAAIRNHGSEAAAIGVALHQAEKVAARLGISWQAIFVR